MSVLVGSLAVRRVRHPVAAIFFAVIVHDAPISAYDTCTHALHHMELQISTQRAQTESSHENGTLVSCLDQSFQCKNPKRALSRLLCRGENPLPTVPRIRSRQSLEIFPVHEAARKTFDCGIIISQQDRTYLVIAPVAGIHSTIASRHSAIAVFRMI